MEKVKIEKKAKPEHLVYAYGKFVKKEQLQKKKEKLKHWFWSKYKILNTKFQILWLYIQEKYYHSIAQYQDLRIKIIYKYFFTNNMNNE